MSNFKNKIGKLKFKRCFLINSNPQTLKAIFSNFFPIQTEINYGLHFNDEITYIGYSEYFEEIENSITLPLYEIVLKYNKYNECFLEEFKKVE